MIMRGKKEVIAAMFFILPSFLGILVFYIVPYILCFWQSLFIGDTFVGLENYISLFSNYTFMLSMRNTLIFTVTAIPLLMIVSLLIALFLNSFEKLSSFFRSSLLIPIVIPVSSLIAVWQLLFEDNGAINGFLHALGIPTAEFFDSAFSMVMIILIYVWKHCGFCVILFTAALANIPESYVESARLDGAGAFRIVKSIKLPNIAPTIFFVFLMALIYSFKIYREAFALFGDYPNENVYFLQNFVNNNYYNLNYSRLSAASIILSLLLVGVLLVFFIRERKKNYLEG